MKKGYLSKVLGMMLMCGVLFGTSPAWASAAQDSGELLQGQTLDTVSDSLLGGVAVDTVEEPSVRETTEYQTTIPHTKRSGTNNYFIFPEGKWTEGNANHTWSNAVDANNPSATYYEVKFVGHKIDVYAGKNRPMGKVKYYIDDVEKGEYDLYRASNIDSELIATFSDLSEGPHTFKAVATGTKNDSANNTLIDAAQVVVYHNRYEVTSITADTTPVAIKVGQTHTLNYTVAPDYAGDGNITFESKNPDIVTVDANGVVTANREGNATVDIKSVADNKSASVIFNVTADPTQLKTTIVDDNLQWTADKYSSLETADEKTAETLYAWRNDIAVSQISILTIDSAAQELTATAGDFTGPEGAKIGKENVKLTFIKSVDAYTGMPGYGNPSRPVPTGSRQEANEILYQDGATPIDVKYEGLQNVWVSIEVPENTAAGTYTGEISITAKGLDTPEKVTYTLEVADAVLPNEEDFADGFDIELWQNPYASAEYYNVTPFSEEHFTILRPIMEKYKSIGGYAITTTIVEEAWAGQTYSANDVKYPSMVDWTKKADGTWSFDYTDFDKWVKFNKELGIGDKIICYSIAPWSCAITYHNEATNQTERITVGAANGWNQNWENAWRAFLQDLIQHVTDEGWKDYTYIGIDERGFSANAFNLIDSVLDIKGVPLKTAGAMDGFVDKRDLAMRLDVLSVGSIAVKAHLNEFEEIRQERDELGLKTTVYTCTGHKPGSFSLNAPGESYWTMMYSYSVGGSGYMRWAYDSWVADPLRDTTHNAFEAGDCFLIFPDEKENKDNPIVRSSTRLEKMAQGVRDVNKLLIMEKEVSAMAAEVDALMETIKPTYDSGNYYLTDSGKTTLANDMNEVQSKIHELTQTYLQKKANGTNTVSSVSIAEGTATTVGLNGTKQLSAVVAPENLLNQRVTWSSENEDIVSVSSAGVVTGHKIGSTNIKATSVQDSTKSATIRVTVERPTFDSAIQVSYYSFDEDSNNVVNDSWGERNGTNVNGEYVDGKSGKGIKVNGTTKATFPAASNLTEQWTVGYWMYLTQTPSGRSSVMMSADTYYSLNNQMHNSAKPGVNVGSGSGSFLTMNGTIPVNTWINMTWTNDRTNGLRLYINGIKTAENIWTKTNNFPAPVEVVGGTGFNGIVDEIKIYNRALTDTEVAASMLTNGLNIAEPYVEMNPGDTHTIEVDLLSNHEDQTITFTSSDQAVASVDSNGVVTAIKKGRVTITVANEAGGYTEEVIINITKELGFGWSIEQYELPEKYLSDVEKDQGGPRQYLAHPDMIMLDDNQTLITAYAIGHGKGEVVMQISRDAGETWEEKTDKPASWLNSYETPTLYKLDFLDGSQKLIMISGRPNWYGNTKGGWDTSISNDNGETWSEYVTQQPTLPNGSQNWSIVAMASLIRIKDDNGNYMDKWMAIYHGYGYYNYKTYLTFDENGNEQWSAPELYLDEYRAIEAKYGICEVGLFRSPDGNRIIGLARSDNKNSNSHKSVMFYSDDEGETWSEPMEMPASLYGERHKMVYDPISGRLVITFREIVADKNGDGVHGGGSDWYAGEWIAWVGTYEDILEQNEGQYRILLDRDYAQNTYSGDTGYAGIVVQPDGTLIMDTYGHFDEEFSKNWTGGVTTDLSWIRQAKFKLGDIDYALGLVNRDALQAKYDELKSVDSAGYTADSYAAFSEALRAAKAGLDDTSMQQIQLDDLQEELEKAYAALESSQMEEDREAARTALKALIDSVSSYKEADYQEAAFKNLTEKLNAAKTAYNKADATVAELEAAKTALETAKKQADSNKATSGAQLEAARKALKTLMDSVSSYKKADYKEAAFKNLTEKLNAAKTVYNTSNSTVAQLQAAKTALEAAKKQADSNKAEITPKPWPFTDIKVNSGWKYDNVKYVYENNIMNGISGTTLFKPDAQLNRAMFATVLYRMADSPKITFENKFKDVKAGQYYSDAIIWANKQGIVQGFTDGTYGVEVNITREQIAKMLCEYAKLMKYDISGAAALDSFTDVEKVSNWAVGYMKWAVDTGMITGKPNDDGKTYRLDPKGEATRAECAKMLTMFMKEYR